MWKFLKSTFTGGVLLLLPVLLCVLGVVKGFGLLRKMVAPIAHGLPFEVSGIGKTTLLTILILLVLCLLAGLFMQSLYAKRLKNFLENEILVHVPGYSYIEALSTDKLTENHESTWKPAIIMDDSSGIICFVVEESEHYYAIFLPSAPSPSSGSVCIRPKEEVQLMNVGVSEAVTALKRFGRGAATLLEKEKISKRSNIPE